MKQLLREFLLPLAIALAWTLYNVSEPPQGQWSVRTFVNVFGPSFFFVSWLSAQWHRVRKQQKVEAGLSGIEASVKSTLHALDEKTADLVGYISGGESVCYLMGPNPETDVWTQLLLVHVGRHPLYEVSAQITDLDEFDKIKNNLTRENLQRCEFQRNFGNLVVGHARYLQESINLGPGNSRRFNIFYIGRNGSFTQLLRCQRVAGTWLFATKVVRSDKTFFERVAEGYPRKPDGSVDWDG
ncbi:MAG: hypothetical protein IPH35_04760 [Rhodoferax sp.]|nr:hypothetical protein [Rhodoferax sp.]